MEELIQIVCAAPLLVLVRCWISSEGSGLALEYAPRDDTEGLNSDAESFGSDMPYDVGRPRDRTTQTLCTGRGMAINRHTNSVQPHPSSDEVQRGATARIVYGL